MHEKIDFSSVARVEPGGGTALAQPYAPNEAGVTMGHWHLNSRDVDANKKIFLAMGGTDGPAGRLQRVIFPGVVVNPQSGAGSPAGDRRHGRIGGQSRRLHREERAGVRRQVEGRRRSGAARQQRPARSGLCGDAGRPADRNPGKQEPARCRSATSTSTSSCRNPRFPQSQAWYAKIFGAKPATAQQRAGR